MKRREKFVVNIFDLHTCADILYFSAVFPGRVGGQVFGGDYIQVGDVLAEKYRVERILGRGGMGMVVAAWHIDLQERRALKFMLPDPTRSPAVVAETVERFMREARAVTKLESPHAVRIHDIARLADGVPYIVMEYLEGMDLHGLLDARGPLPVDEACRYILQACEAIGEAHGLGIVHRDLKPANLFLKRGARGEPIVKVLDFGIAKVTAGAGAQHQSLTVTQSTMGTPAYMSPEQVSNTKAVDGRADIWSLGVILYQLTTCALPFVAEHMPVLFAKILDDREVARPPSLLNPAISPEFDAVVLRCLQKDIHLRFQTIGQLVDALTPFVSPGTRASAPALPAMNVLTVPMATIRKGGDTLPVSSEAPTIPKAIPAAGNQPMLGSHVASGGQTFQGGLVKPASPNASVRNAIVASSVTTALVAGLVVWFVSTRGGKVEESASNTPPRTAESAIVQDKPAPDASVAQQVLPAAAPVASSSSPPKPQAPLRTAAPKATTSKTAPTTTSTAKSKGGFDTSH